MPPRATFSRTTTAAVRAELDALAGWLGLSRVRQLGVADARDLSPVRLNWRVRYA